MRLLMLSLILLASTATLPAAVTVHWQSGHADHCHQPKRTVYYTPTCAPPPRYTVIYRDCEARHYRQHRSCDHTVYSSHRHHNHHRPVRQHVHYRHYDRRHHGHSHHGHHNRQVTYARTSRSCRY